jgi:hypothetical protein
MERLQWWLLLLSAVMFSMSGCATGTDWRTWSEHPVHYASGDHLAFSVRSHDTAASIKDADTVAATREDWWGRLVPEDVVAAEALDVTGHWRGTWTATGPFGEIRVSTADVVFVQSGVGGTGRVRLTDTVAATGVPSIVRQFGSWGVPVSYQVARGQVVARYDNGPAMEMRFTRVGERLYGRVASSPSLLLVLEKDAAAQ